MRTMRSRTTHAVLFALDGVLVDSRDVITRCINALLAEHGLSQHRRIDLYRFIGPPLAVAFAQLTNQAPDSPLVVSCVRNFRKRYKSRSNSRMVIAAPPPS
jgi:phosphoglycolate phosphatase-like HAD superfamily hydrolase